MGVLSGKSAIVTGAAQGMGASHARKFVEAGARVVLTDVQADAGEKLAKELGDAARFVRQDVTSASDWDQVIRTAQAHGGGLHVLVNNAAIHWQKSIESDTVEGLRRMLDVNVAGVFLGIQKSIAPMRAAGGGSIINVSSIAGTRGIPAHGSYGASKWAVRGLTKVAAAELGRHRIRVNSIHPGGIAGTGMFPDPQGEERRAQYAAIPLGRAGETSEVSDLVIFLASDASTYITGTEHVIDGGRSLW
jgi:3alpha(or 20beta)-hydroxysteroid dehydrogenase